MLKLILVFLIAFGFSFFFAQYVSSLSKENRVKFIKSVAYFVGVGTVTILLLSIIVFLF